MELYVLDSLLRRATVIDVFNSCVWTERYNDLGDCTLEVTSTQGNRSLLTPGTYLANNRSRRVMRIDTAEDKTNTDGSHVLTCTCSSIEVLMDEKPVRDSMANGLTAEPKWVVTGLPAAIARQLFTTIMVNGALDPNDVLPFYASGNLYPADGLPEPTTSINYSVDTVTLFAALKTLCQTYDLGFRITRNADNSQLFFNVYSGNDRTSDQTVLPAVLFSTSLNNLLNSSYLTSAKQYRNIAYVYGADATLKVYDPGYDSTTTGFARRVLPVAASDIHYPDRTTAGSGGVPAYTVTTSQQNSIKTAQTLSTTTQLQSDSLAKLTKMQRILPQDLVNIQTVTGLTGTTLTSAQITDINNAVTASQNYNPTEDAAYAALLTARGLQELNKWNNVTAFDGQIPQQNTYVYDQDYFLGDLAEVRNADGVQNQVRVTEQIFSQDASGEKSYPTLSSRLVITPGTWAAWSASQNWADVPDTTYWSSLS